MVSHFEGDRGEVPTGDTRKSEMSNWLFILLWITAELFLVVLILNAVGQSKWLYWMSNSNSSI